MVNVARQRAIVCGVYTLYVGDEVAYVGQSKSVYARIAQHLAGAPFYFDTFVIEECDSDSLCELEAKLIHKHNPRWNKEIPAYGDKKHTRRSHWQAAYPGSGK